MRKWEIDPAWPVIYTKRAAARTATSSKDKQQRKHERWGLQKRWPGGLLDP